MSRVVEGFYVRFFWDWLAFISGAFRWKVIGLMSDAIPKAHKTEAINLQSVLLIFDS